MKLAYYSIIFIILSVTGCSQYSQDNDRREFNEEQLQEFNASARFDYNRTVESYNNPVLEIIAKFFTLLSWLLNSFLGYLIIAVMIGLLIYIIINNSSWIFLRKGDAGISDAVLESDQEDIELIDYDLLLHQALIQHDFRLAIRYKFLKILKTLQQAGMIEWHREKTNHQYLLEIPEIYRNEFRQIIAFYEYTWYGQFATTENLYQKVNERVRLFREKISMPE